MGNNEVFHFKNGEPNRHSEVAGDPFETHSDGDLELGSMVVPSSNLARPMHRRTSSKSALVSDFSSGKEEVRTQFASVSSYCDAIKSLSLPFSHGSLCLRRFVRSTFTMHGTQKNGVSKALLYIHVRYSAAKWIRP